MLNKFWDIHGPGVMSSETIRDIEQEIFKLLKYGLVSTDDMGSSMYWSVEEILINSTNFEKDTCRVWAIWLIDIYKSRRTE